MDRAEAIKQWRIEFAGFLNAIGIVSLRTLGRYVGVSQATARKKGELVDCILAIVSGERLPAAKSNRGAPVKEDFVDPAILSGLDELNFKRAAIEADYGEEATEENNACFSGTQPSDSLVLSAKNQDTAYYDRAVFCGELTTLSGSYCVKITEPRELLGEKAVISSKNVELSGARTGDKLTFHAGKQAGFYIVYEVLSVNAVLPGTLFENFDRADAVYPCEKLLSFESDGNLLLKYFVTLFPVGKGQRVLVSGVPKSGKSTLLREIARSAAKNDAEIKIVAGLCERSPETIGEWRREFPVAEIYASGYCDEPDEQISQAEKALKCAKEYVCDGKNALLLFDDLNALARAFNETEESAGGRTLAGGLESKTVHYLKKFLGSARRLKSGASLTVFAVLSTETGSPFDAVLSQELLGVSSATWQLSGNFRRGKTAIPDGTASHVDNEEKFLSAEESKTLDRLFSVGAEKTFSDGKEEILKESASAQDFLSRILGGNQKESMRNA